MAQSVNGNHRHSRLPAVARKNIIYRRIVHRLFMNKNRLILRQVFHQLGKLHDLLPVDLDFPDGGLVLRRRESRSDLVIPGLVDVQKLMRKIKVCRGKAQRLGKPHPRFRDKQNEPVPADGIA